MNIFVGTLFGMIQLTLNELWNIKHEGGSDHTRLYKEVFSFTAHC